MKQDTKTPLRTVTLSLLSAMLLSVVTQLTPLALAITPHSKPLAPVQSMPQSNKTLGVKAHQPWSPTFKQDFHRGFMQACVDGVAKKTGVKPAQSYCSCFADDIEANFSEEDLTTMSKAANSREQMNTAFQPTVDKCSPRILDGLE
jgi:hypothetical protein